MVLEPGKVDLVLEKVRAVHARCSLLPIFFALLAIVNVRGAGAQTKPPDAAADETTHFEVAAIKPSKPDNQNHNWNGSADRILIENYTLRRLIRSAYGLKSDSQILGGPDWLDKQSFDINAKVDDAEIAKMAKMDRLAKQRERNVMLQSLLAERFALKAHLERRTMPVYALVVAKSGAKLTPTSPETAAKGHNISTNNGRMTASAISMDSSPMTWHTNPKPAAEWFSIIPGLPGSTTSSSTGLRTTATVRPPIRPSPACLQHCRSNSA